MKSVIVMGGGPAGLASAYELKKNKLDVTVFEADSEVGGISKTVKYNGYHFDLGGHRFFTKLDEVNELWSEVLGEDLKKTPRLSRIFYKNKFFNYPLTPVNALTGVGVFDTLGILMSYFKSKVLPYSQEETFEEWVSNRFGKRLYSIFFKTYTEKVWGIPCSSIQAEWAAQRIKGLSLRKAIVNALIKPKDTDIKTLINEFDYPVYGPGMMYNAMKNKIEEMGGDVFINSKVVKVNHKDFMINSIEYIDKDGNLNLKEGTHFISSIPITELVDALNPASPKEVINARKNLTYRSIITIDIIINKKEVFPDNWIYIHSPEVILGRIQNFKNWSNSMVPDQNKTSLGLEYFCDEDDDLWNMTDDKLYALAACEIERIGLCKVTDIEDYIIVRVPKAYPVYSTGYKAYMNVIEKYLRKFSNLQLVGRYGLFKYNNMDHSILTGLYAAKNIQSGKNIYDTWSVNTDDDYHEEKGRGVS